MAINVPTLTDPSLNAESDTALLDQWYKIPESLKNGSRSCYIMQFRVHLVTHSVQIPAYEITL